MPESVRIFLSAVSNEFGDYRDQLRSKLTRHNVEVKIQEDFKDLGGTTLEKLDDYIKLCGAVVHLVGGMTGAAAGAFTTKAIRDRYSDLAQRFPPLGDALSNGYPISYTQWEAWLALYHRKVLLIAKADDTAPRGPSYAPTDESRVAQENHLKRLRAVGRHPGNTFTGPDNLTSEIFSTAILDLLAQALSLEYLAKPPPLPQPKNLPYASLGLLFKGRELFLQRLHTTLARAGAGEAATATALQGLGGVGKTRAAIEYALRHRQNYSALLFVRAGVLERQDAGLAAVADDSGKLPEKDTHEEEKKIAAALASLEAGLAALAGADILDLPEKEAREDAVKTKAVLGWLEQHPLWLMIVDNVDDEPAAAAVEALLPKLFGGRVLITSRITNFSAAVEMLPVDVLGIEDAAAFLLERTEGRRAETPYDVALARELAQKLGGLALGLEQAGAYIAKLKIGFARYLKLWKESQAKVLGWFDPRLMAYHQSLATTWAASVEQLTPAGRRLLERLAFFAPEPVPESLLDVAAPGDDANFDAYEARADLFAYSLASFVAADGRAAPAFAIHRLVQEFTLRRLDEAKRKKVLTQALGWVDAAFTGDPQDVQSWPTLDPLASHALALAWHADEARIPEPTARLMSALGILLYAKSRYVKAEPLLRRALAIGEASFGPDHPKVAIRLNNLGELLRDTNRLAEAEQYTRRALSITEASYGEDHPDLARPLNTLALLLKETNRLAEAEPLTRRALAIDEANFGADDTEVARDLNNLALLLHAMKRLPEAEPMYRRALAIDEASFGAGHPKVANRLSNLAGLLRETNRLAEAEPLMRRALAIDEASFGPNHPTVAISLNNLAELLRVTNRFAEAERLYRRALAIFEASYGLDHPNVAVGLNNLAELLQYANRLAEAEPLARRVVEILLSFVARTRHEHPHLQEAFNNYANLLRAMGRSEAEASAAVEALIRAHGLTQP